MKENTEVENLGKKTKIGYMIETEPYGDTASDLTKITLMPLVHKQLSVLPKHSDTVKFLSNLYRFKNNLATVVRIEKKYPEEIGYIYFEDFNYAVVYSPYIPQYGHKLICSLYFNQIEDQMVRITKKLFEFYFPRCEINKHEYHSWRNALTRFININGLDPKNYDINET